MHTITEEIPFAQSINERGEEETLHLDLYLPESGDRPFPTIVWFHGGGFRLGNDKRQRYIVSFAQHFADAGYACVAPDYRIRAEPESDWSGAVRDAVEDGRKLLQWLSSSSAGHYGIDPSRLVLAGGSAGGMLVNNLVHDAGRPLGRKDGIYALVNLWGSPNPAARQFGPVSPICPPNLIVHGTADQLVDYRYSADLAEELQAAGVSCLLLTLPGAPHTPVPRAGEFLGHIQVFLNQHGLPVE